MTCSKCGTALVPGARFCGGCGNAVAVNPSGPPSGATPSPSRPDPALMRTLLAPGPTPQPAAETPAPSRTPAPLVTPGPMPSIPAPEDKSGPIKAAPATNPQTVPTVVRPVSLESDLVGTMLNNRYLVKERIGEGGFGAVYSGEQVAMGRECAIKVLHGRMARDPQVVGRFRREAQAASVLRAAHTVQIYDFDQTPEGVLYLAMELLHGRSLLSEMQKGPMSSQRVAHILIGIADSLGEAHAQGIVHRDIKPENIFLETRGNDTDFVKVLDFGIAKIMSGEGHLSGPQLTAAGQTLGTLEYMSPEQLMGQQLDGRSDLYALGMLSYEMLCGQLPFWPLRQPGEIITAHIKTIPKPPSQVKPELGISPLVDQIVLRLVEKQRDKRYRDAAEMQADLRRVLAGETGVPARAAAVPAAAAPSAMGGDVVGRPVAGGADAELGRPGLVILSQEPNVRPLEIEPSHSYATTTPSMPTALQRNAARNNRMLVIGGVVLAIIAVGLLLLLLSGKAGAAEPPPPSRLVPASYVSVLACDFPQLRASLPAAAAGALMESLRPAFARVGIDPARLGRTALGFAALERPAVRVGGEETNPGVFVLDGPIDHKRFETWASHELKRGQKFVNAAHHGVKYRKSPALEYAFLPGDRLVLAGGSEIRRALDLQRGEGAPLVDGAAAGLLHEVEADGGRGPALLSWTRVDEATRSELRRALPSAAGLEELAASLALGPSGAEVKGVGRCASPEAATQTAEEVRGSLARARKEPAVALFGLLPLVDAVKLETRGAEVWLSLHLTPAQYADLITRLVGLAVAGMHELARASDEPPPPAPTRGRKQRAKPAR